MLNDTIETLKAEAAKHRAAAKAIQAAIDALEGRTGTEFENNVMRNAEVYAGENGAIRVMERPSIRHYVTNQDFHVGSAGGVEVIPQMPYPSVAQPAVIEDRTRKQFTKEDDAFITANWNIAKPTHMSVTAFDAEIGAKLGRKGKSITSRRQVLGLVTANRTRLSHGAA